MLKNYCGQTNIFFGRRNIIFGRPLCQGATLDRVKRLIILNNKVSGVQSGKSSSTANGLQPCSALDSPVSLNDIDIDNLTNVT